LNAHIERYPRSLKEECLERLILFGKEPLRNASGEFLMHFHAEFLAIRAVRVDCFGKTYLPQKLNGYRQSTLLL
jgi:hypothetical protein